ncbi:MAG: hypothetical protein AB7G23_08275 [Vicinamibacterales bacterium]
MCSILRLHLRTVAATLLVALVAAGDGIVLHGIGEAHVVTGGAWVAAHDASAHRIGAGEDGTRHEAPTCLVCQWTRAFHPSPDGHVLPGQAPEARVGLVRAAVHVPAQVRFAHPPLRSPPPAPAHD